MLSSVLRSVFAETTRKMSVFQDESQNSTIKSSAGKQVDRPGKDHGFKFLAMQQGISAYPWCRFSRPANGDPMSVLIVICTDERDPCSVGVIGWFEWKILLWLPDSIIDRPLALTPGPRLLKRLTMCFVRWTTLGTPAALAILLRATPSYLNHGL